MRKYLLSETVVWTESRLQLFQLSQFILFSPLNQIALNQAATKKYLLRCCCLCPRLWKVFLPGFLKLQTLPFLSIIIKIKTEVSSIQNHRIISPHHGGVGWGTNSSYSTEKQNWHQKIWAIRKLNFIFHFGTGFMFTRLHHTSESYFIQLG